MLFTSVSDDAIICSYKDDWKYTFTLLETKSVFRNGLDSLATATDSLVFKSSLGFKFLNETGSSLSTRRRPS